MKKRLIADQIELEEYPAEESSFSNIFLALSWRLKEPSLLRIRGKTYMWMNTKKLVVLACALTVPGFAAAITISDSFGPFPNANFGGTGIPNDSVAASTQIIDGTTTITIAMSATQRFSNPALSNNGSGVYSAGTGSNFGGAGESATEGALWNWNYYIEVDGGQITDLSNRYLLRFRSGRW